MQPDDFAEIIYTVRDNVATVTLNRPQRRNAWTGRMAVEYRWALYRAENDPDVGAIVVTGSGDTFCAGADMQILDEVDENGGAYQRVAADLPPFPDDAPSSLRHNHTYPLALGKPTVAALNGPCAGAGFVLACFTDFRISVDDNKITASFAGLGLPAEYGLAWTLTRIVGQQNALEILLANPVMSGDRARDLGFVRTSVGAADLDDHVHEFARGMAQHSSPAALKVIKRQVYLDAWGDLETAYERAVTDMNRMVGEPDFSVGLRAARRRERARYLPRDDEVD
ncbi:enoyl-CoA hydratase-related protein [uncultured Jatrophihabitans sp.]|uniref:enoyl-CoA hydratase-related protein n=1 Tax=uncultured Jatrophihabitans sp. TaxID=1610747 RepID=UPI0035CB1D00